MICLPLLAILLIGLGLYVLGGFVGFGLAALGKAAKHGNPDDADL